MLISLILSRKAACLRYEVDEMVVEIRKTKIILDFCKNDKRKYLKFHVTVSCLYKFLLFFCKVHLELPKAPFS